MSAELDGEELLALARLDLQQGRVEAGLLKLKQILVGKAPAAEAQLDVARLYAELGLRKKAQIHFKSYLEQRPDDVDARFQLGMTLFEDNDAKSAQSLWDQVLKRSPQYPPALYFVAVAAAQAGKVAEARQQLKSLMQAVPSDNLYFGRANDLLKNLEKAGDKTDTVRIIGAASAYRTDH